MSGVSADLEFSVADALAQVEQLASAIESATTDVTLTVDVDASAVSTTITEASEAEPVEIAVEADAAQAAEEIATVADGAPDGVDVPVDAPGAEDAQQQIAGLTDTVTDLDSVVAGLGLGALGAGLYAVVGAFGEAERVGAITGQIIENVGASAGVTEQHVSDLALRIQEYSGISDEAVIQAAGVVASFENIANSADGTSNNFDRTIEQSANLAVAMGTELPAAASTLARALAQPESAAARLRRAKIILTEAEQAQIEAFVAAGDTAAAQAVVLDAVERKYGDVAAAAGDTLTGGLDRGREAFGNILEVIGGGVAAVLGPAVAVVATLGESFTSLPGPVQAFIGAFTGVIVLVGVGVAAFAALTIAANAASAALAGTTVAALATNPVFLAIAATAAVLVGVYAALTSGNQEAAQASDEYTQALRDQAAGQEQAVAQAVALQAAEDGIVETARAAGVSLEDVTGSILGTRDVVPELTSELGSLQDALDRINTGADPEFPLSSAEGQAEVAAIQERIALLQELIGYIEEQNGSLGASEDALAAEEAALAAVGAQSQATAEEIGAFVDSVVGKLPGVADAFARARDAGSNAFESLALASDPAVVGQNLQTIAFEILAFGENLRVVAEAGFADVAATLAELGPETAGGLVRSLADAVRSGNPEVLAAFAEQAASIPGALEAITPILEGLGVEIGTEGGESASDAFGQALDFSTPASAESGSAAGAITSGSGQITGSSAAAGEQAASGFANTLGLIAALTQGQMAVVNALIIAGGVTATASAGTAGRSAGLALSSGFLATAPALIPGAMAIVTAQIVASGVGAQGSARTVGRGIGVALGQGIISGISSQVSAIANEAARAVNEAEAAARAAADANSPSRLMAELGYDMGAGVAVGLAEAQRAVVAEAEAIVRAAAAPVAVGATAVPSAAAEVAGVAGGDTYVFGPGAIVQRFDGPADAGTVRTATAAGVGDAIELARLRGDARRG